MLILIKAIVKLSQTFLEILEIFRCFEQVSAFCGYSLYKKLSYCVSSKKYKLTEILNPS